MSSGDQKVQAFPLLAIALLGEVNLTSMGILFQHPRQGPERATWALKDTHVRILPPLGTLHQERRVAKLIGCPSLGSRSSFLAQSVLHQQLSPFWGVHTAGAGHGTWELGVLCSGINSKLAAP